MKTTKTTKKPRAPINPVGVNATMKIAITGVPIPESTTTRVLGQVIAAIDTIDPEGVALGTARSAVSAEMDRRRALPTSRCTFARQGGRAVMVQLPWDIERVTIAYTGDTVVISRACGGETP